MLHNALGLPFCSGARAMKQETKGIKMELRAGMKYLELGSRFQRYCKEASLYYRILTIDAKQKTRMKEKEIIRRGEGENYNYSQDHCFIKLSSKRTQGELSIVEDTLKPGFYLGRHHHKIMTEVFYILEGEVELIFDDEVITGKPGDTITIPPNVWHAASCEKGGKMLTIFKNGQFDLFLERLSNMSESDFADADLMKSVSAEFDIYEE